MTTVRNIITNLKYLEKLKNFKQRYTQLPWYKRFLFNIFSYDAAQALAAIDIDKQISADLVFNFTILCRKNWCFKTLFGLLDDFVENTSNIGYFVNHDDKVVKVPLTDEVKDFIHRNRANPRLPIIYSLIGRPSSTLENKENTESIFSIFSEAKPSFLISAANIKLLFNELDKIDFCNMVCFFDVLHALKERGLLTQGRLDALSAHQERNHLFNVLIFASFHDVLNEITFEAIINSEKLANVEAFFHRFQFIDHRLEGWKKSHHLGLRSSEFIAILTSTDPHHYLVSDSALEIVLDIVEYCPKYYWDRYAQLIWTNLYNCCTQAVSDDTKLIYVRLLIYVKSLIHSNMLIEAYSQKVGRDIFKTPGYQATRDLPYIICRETANYLSTIVNDSPSILDIIKKDGIVAIWDKIREAVKKSMIEKFGFLYKNVSDKTDRFIDLNINVPQVNAFRVQEEIAASEGSLFSCKN